MNRQPAQGSALAAIDRASMLVNDDNDHDGLPFDTDKSADVRADLASARAAFGVLIEKADNYYTRYCQDEAAEDGADITGCSPQQSEDARALRDALRGVGAR